MSGYDAVMRVAAHEDADLWLPIIRMFHTLVVDTEARYGTAANELKFAPDGMEAKPTRIRWLRRWRTQDPGLLPLCDAGVLTEVDEVERPDRAHVFRMPDPDGVGRALDELRVRFEWRSTPRFEYES